MQGFVLIGILGVIGFAIGVYIAFEYEGAAKGLLIAVLGFCLSFVSFCFVNHIEKYNCEIKIEVEVQNEPK